MYRIFSVFKCVNCDFNWSEFFVFKDFSFWDVVVGIVLRLGFDLGVLILNSDIYND